MSSLTAWCWGIEEGENRDQSREESRSRAPLRQRGSHASKSQQKTPAASGKSPNRPRPAFRESGSNPSSSRSSRLSCRPLWQTNRARNLRARLRESKRVPASSSLPASCGGAEEYCRTRRCSKPSPKEKTQPPPSARTKTQSRAGKPARQPPSADCDFCDSRSVQVDA
jgi:hypothetical protein